MLMTVLKNTRELFTLIKFIYSTNKIYKHIKKNNLISDKLIGKSTHKYCSYLYSSTNSRRTILCTTIKGEWS